MDFMGATDTMGIKLLDQQRMQEIWRTQQLHLECIQDPPIVQLYRNTGQVTKDGVILPSCTWLNIPGVVPRIFALYVFFHGDLNLFLGTSANTLHFQMYLLGGLVQWNEARGVAAVEGASREEICYGGQLLQYCNALSQQLLALKLAQDYTSPGELIGVEYLYHQTSRAFEEDVGVDPDIPDGIREDDLQGDLEGDEGFEDICLDEPIEFMELEGTDLHPLQEQTGLLFISFHVQSVGPDGQAGYDHVIRLANSLVALRHQRFVSQCKVDEIVMLWNNLSDHDKGRLIYPPCHRDRQLKGRFKVSHSKTNVTPGTESLKRCFLGVVGPAQWPSTSRVGEAICLALCRIDPAGQTIAGLRVNRWAAIIRDYRMLLGSPGIMARTKLKLFELNQLTISRWHNDLQGGSGLHQPGRIHRAFEEHFTADPDTPNELRDKDQEGDEGFEDLSFDEPLEFGAHLQCVLISFDAQVESVGPDGQAGYDHVIKLANRLVELCHQGFVTQEKVDEIVTLWDNPSEHGMGRVP
ncbi:unnamed protein product [Leuciscus chuanchicus]